MSTIGPGDLERANARTKSYTTQAILTLVLHLVLWVPGLIANILFLMDARRMERIAGQTLPGVGCLWILLASQIIGFVVACCAIVLLFGTTPGR